MEEPRGHACPECGAARESDGSPSCPCGQRAADALRATRTAEAAAAEDFDPLRIRPYVDLESGGEGDGAAPDAARSWDGAPDGGSGTEDRAPAAGSGPPAPDDGTRPLRAASAEPAAPPPMPPTAAEPSASGLSPFGPAGAGSPDPGRRPHDAARPADPTAPSGTTGPPSAAGPTNTGGPPGATGRTTTTGVPNPTRPPDHTRSPGTPRPPVGTGEERRRTRRTRRAVLLAVAGAAVAGVAGAGLASGLFSYDKPVRDGAAPREVRVRVPDVPPATIAPSGPTAVAPPARPTPARPRPSADASPSPSPSASASDASPSPSRSGAGSGAGTAGPTQTASPVRATATVEPALVLRRGDQGPEVTELQLRLAQLGLYTGPADGVFGRQVEDSVSTYQWARGIRADETGVYGPATRASLEAETSEP
ncbi:peptidoglycan-binding protein [Streptomyces sp. NPDC086766]|uniref:peptidoglycan-binding domain-containing protein n=1 Tax=Streptomyces sp. NPDC086766 TaxID=3365754 RepID=UPI0037F61792